ncbi:hypothetical protein WG907_13685 [Sphingobium sp. AN558]|uniref:hypothetical protein n=1 Tax=Sphingobium sp. AN558 TaxID=3133442 RepID=UPI0030BFC640
MTAPRLLGWLVIAIMSVLMANILIHDGMDHGVGFDTFAAGASNPWQLFINNDLVTGLLFMCGWIILRERGGRVIDTIAWVWMVMWWGNIIVGVYVLRAAWQAGAGQAGTGQSGGDWHRFFLGRHAGSLPPVTIAAPLRMLAALAALAVAIWTIWTIRATGFAPIPTMGLTLGFAPIVLTFALLALPARPAPAR